MQGGNMSWKTMGATVAALGFLLLITASSYAGDDMTITEKMTAGGTTLATHTLVKGTRERTTMDMGVGMTTVTIRQCDLKRSLTVNDSQKTFLIKPDLEEGDSSKAAAAALLGAVPAAENGGTITYTSKVMDTGEKKQIYGYTARHLKTTVLAQSSPNACNAVKQKYDIDGWYIDVKEQAGCQRFSPYINDVQGCHDRIVLNQAGTLRPGLAVQETVSITNGDNPPMVITREVTELKKGPLAQELFDLPADYRQVSSAAELYGIPSTMARAAAAGTSGSSDPYASAQADQRPKMPGVAQMMNPVTGPATALAAQQQALARAQQMGVGGPGSNLMGGMTGMGAPSGSTAVAAPALLGQKAPGKVRIGVAPPDAQLGQGSNAGADYSTPIRNAIVALMSGPAVEVAALDSHVPMQVQAEAQQKECDFILYSTVMVKHSSGGFGKFMKMATPLASVAPMAGMGGNVAGAAAAQAAGAAASAAAMSAQQEAIQQLAGFNGQIKSKDDVTMQYQLNSTGQPSPRLQNQLTSKAKSNGEDVLTPLLTQAATTILTEVTKR
jgi:hypothetical protein